MCVDWRKLNGMTIKSKYPLPRIDDLLDKLSNARYMTGLDLQSGYHQIRISESDQKLTAFRAVGGLWKYKVLPFGLVNAPATFECAMESIFREHLYKFVLVYLDDILVFSQTEEEHYAAFDEDRPHNFETAEILC